MIKKNLNIALHPDTYVPISFELGMMLDTTKGYCSIPALQYDSSLNDSSFAQGHRGCKKATTCVIILL